MSDILTSIDNGVARLTINRPESRNAIRAETLTEIYQFLLGIEHDPEIGAVILDAAGPHFAAGADLKGFAESAALPPRERAGAFEQMVHQMNPLLLTIERIPQIVIASVRGFAAGSSVGLIAAADLVIASETAKFLLAQIKIGTSPDGGVSYFLTRQIGVKRTKELILLGDVLGAADAERYGLVNRVVPDDQLDAETAKLAARLGSGPRRAQAEGKQLINQSLDNTMAEQLWAEARACNRIVQTDDFIEGAASFGEKRAPVFKGR